MTDGGALTLCCLLWAVPGEEAAMSEYEDRVLTLIGEHGAHVLQRVVSDGADGNPHEVQLFAFPGQAALDGYLADERRTAMADLRDRVVARTELFGVQPRSV